MTPAEAWADAQKYMSPDEIARISKQVSPTGQFNPGQGGQWDTNKLVQQFNATPEAQRGNFINSVDQAGLGGGAPANIGAALQQALRGQMGQKEFDNWYASKVQNVQGSGITAPAGMPSGSAPPGATPPMGKSTPAMTGAVGGGAGGWSPFAMSNQRYASQGGQPGGSYYGPTAGYGPAARGGGGMSKGLMVDPGDPGGGGGGAGGGSPIAQLLQRLMLDRAPYTGTASGRRSGASPLPYSRALPPPAPTGPPSGGPTSGSPGVPGGPTDPSRVPPSAPPGTVPYTWNGQPLRSFDPSYLIRSMRQHFGAGGGAGQSYSVAPMSPKWSGNSGSFWQGAFQQGPQ